MRSFVNPCPSWSSVPIIPYYSVANHLDDNFITSQRDLQHGRRLCQYPGPNYGRRNASWRDRDKSEISWRYAGSNEHDRLESGRRKTERERVRRERTSQQIAFEQLPIDICPWYNRGRFQHTLSVRCSQSIHNFSRCLRFVDDRLSDNPGISVSKHSLSLHNTPSNWCRNYTQSGIDSLRRGLDWRERCRSCLLSRSMDTSRLGLERETVDE
jgi:hypothetical protein